MVIIRLVAAVALGLFVTWLVHLWTGLFESVYVAAAIWIGACIVYAAIYDRRQGQRQRSIEAKKLARQSIEH